MGIRDLGTNRAWDLWSAADGTSLMAADGERPPAKEAIGMETWKVDLGRVVEKQLDRFVRSSSAFLETTDLGGDPWPSVWSGGLGVWTARDELELVEHQLRGLVEIESRFA